MQSTPAGSGSGSGSSSGGGGSQQTRGGISRFRSAPATWLEALLEDDDEDPLKPNQCLTELLTADSSAPPAGRNLFPFPNLDDQGFQQVGFQRQNSSPADFLGGPSAGADGFFSSFENPVSYDYLSPNIDVSPKGEESGQVPTEVTEVSGATDMNVEKLLEDSVPCRRRAKRGYATHPRSIAERVRRTRISDRIRKLQELVPNMDKQTNTADMLEEAVEYVKSLQRQIQELTEQEKRCTCRPKE